LIGDLAHASDRTSLGNLASSSLPPPLGTDPDDHDVSTAEEVAIRIAAARGLGTLAGNGDSIALGMIRALVSSAPHLGVQAKATELAHGLGVSDVELLDRLSSAGHGWLLTRTDVDLALADTAETTFDGDSRPEYDGGTP